MKLLSQGAEAKIFLDDNTIVKNRFKKEYRIPELDVKLRKARTKREAKVLDKLKAINFPCPKVYVLDDKNMTINMEFIAGEKLRDVLNDKNCAKLCEELGKKIAMLHDNNIIHGDLTTSNMILSDKKKEIYFIDFGLSFFSQKIEDKAVDLHLLRQALESKHYEFWEKCYDSAIKGYKKESKEANEVLKRLEAVEKRGRYKRKKH